MTPKIIFAGTPDFAAVQLQALLNAGIRPVMVYTQPDRPAGRGHKLKASEVKRLALQQQLPVRTPLNFRQEEDLKAFEELHSDLCIVAAYGLILPQRVLGAPRCGCLNVHASLLPRYRGAAPIQRALLDGCSETGVTLIKLCKALDSGPIYASAALPITAADTSGTLFDKLAALGASTLLAHLEEILNGKLPPKPQDDTLATYAAKITKAEAPLDFGKSARELELKIRAFNPWPAATAVLNGIKYKVFKASCTCSSASPNLEPGTIVSRTKEGIVVSCGSGELCLQLIQAPGKGPVSAAALAGSSPEKFATGLKFE